MQTYLYCGLVRAQPETEKGVEGYRVYTPGGLSNWIPADKFEENYRPLSRREASLLTLTLEELEVMSISDGIEVEEGVTIKVGDGDVSDSIKVGGSE